MSLLKIKVSSVKLISSNFCKIILKPILKNYASCLAPFLRCLVFTSVKGYAITEVKIYGVNNEFDDIPGVKEDVLNLILNLKGIIFKLKKKKVILYLNKSGESVIKASDFHLNEWVNIINPNYIITYLAKGFSLNITIKVEKGIGFHPINNDNYDKKNDLNGVLLDVNYSPIIRVYYKVKDFLKDEKLLSIIHFFIETNGSISPKKAFCNSVNNFLFSLSNFILIYNNNLLKSKKKNKFISNKKLLTKISSINSDSTFLYYMKKINVVYLGDLIKLTKNKILKISKMNFSLLKNINIMLLKYNLRLNTKLKNWNLNKNKYINNLDNYETS
ncbi:DNA-directed RNA polymerase alpha subunit [Candidatus Nasuia deltocephalinicola]|nr:DNA-directed RNA polymerase alpha subunit [Candidatus Nasuia deltocephalinicola]